MKNFYLKQGIILTFVIFVSTISFAQNYLNQPQKVVIDAPRNRILVSNYATGDIIAIAPDGTQTPFVLDANFVDGMDIVGDTLIGVGNDRHVIAYNLVTKELLYDVILPTETTNDNYLSSVCADSTGNVFISCPGENDIIRFNIKDRTSWSFAKDGGLNRPNGIWLERENNRIVVIDDSPATSIIHAISLIDSIVTDLDTNNFNRPDGIIRANDGFYYVAGYYLDGIYKISPDFLGEPVNIYHETNMVYPTYNCLNNSIFTADFEQDTIFEIFLDATQITEIIVTQEGGVTSINAQDSLQMYAAILPTDATNQSVTWSVSPAIYATINQNGLLRAKNTVGTVTVRAKSNDGSGIQGTIQIAILNHGTSIIEKKNNVKIYPNPLKDVLYIENTNCLGQNFNIEITSISGEVILKKQFNMSNDIVKIDINEYPKGLYLIKIQNENFVKIEKIVVE